MMTRMMAAAAGGGGGGGRGERKHIPKHRPKMSINALIMRLYGKGGNLQYNEEVCLSFG